MNGTELLSMKQFAEYTGLKQSTLRYYDEIGLFSPVRRGENNYRYYSPQQIITLNLIQTLTRLGISLEKIGELERSRTPEMIMELLVEQEDELDRQLRHIRENYSIIHTLNRMIQIGSTAQEERIVERVLRAYPLILGPINDFEDNQFFYETFFRFCAEAKNRRINLCYPVGGYFEDIDVFINTPSQPTRFFSLDPTGADTKKAGRHLVGYIRGYYGDMGDMPERLITYAYEHNFRFTGPLYVTYVHDEITIKDPNRFLAQVSVPVAPNKKRAINRTANVRGDI
ncbi:MAG: MerR family transcriptional regulator [Christensenellaceae bacterium]|jgi:DNA-binding transcriptional MerR regulator|nr:MerR family transcriptional regulator [Christensenellaceae bacterium]